MIDIATAWRPAEPGIEPRFFIADQDGCYHWLGVARSREHFIELLRLHGAEFEVNGDTFNIDQALARDEVLVEELTDDRLARYRRCHTEDERGVIPLSQAAIGDLFCSEW